MTWYWNFVSNAAMVLFAMRTRSSSLSEMLGLNEPRALNGMRRSQPGIGSFTSAPTPNVQYE